MPRKVSKRQREEEDILLEETLPDPLKVENQQPGFAYRAFRDDPTRRSWAQALGYQPVKRDDPEKLIGDYGAMGGDVAGIQRFGDLLLYRIPKEKQQGRDRAKQRHVDRITHSGTRGYRAEARSLAGLEGEVTIRGPGGTIVDRAGKGKGEQAEDAD